MSSEADRLSGNAGTPSPSLPATGGQTGRPAAAGGPPTVLGGGRLDTDGAGGAKLAPGTRTSGPPPWRGIDGPASIGSGSLPQTGRRCGSGSSGGPPGPASASLPAPV